MRPTSLPQLFFFLLALFPSALASFLAVDYGGEWTKASLIKPGTPFDVMLDKDSKRKMLSAVGWKRDERVFGGEAANAATRFPQAHFPYVKSLIGSNDIPTTVPLDLYPSIPSLHPTESIPYFSHPDAPSHVLLNTSSEAASTTSYSSTELLSHQFDYLRRLASQTASESITDLYLTLPAYTPQHIKKAYKDAAEIAGLNLIGVISDPAAIGVNYAVTRTFPQWKGGEGEREVHVIYDSGATGTRAAVLAFYTEEIPLEATYNPVSRSGKKSKPLRPKYANTTIIELLSSSSIPVGGVNLDLAIQELLVRDVAAKFEGSGGVEGIRADKRVMRRLWREAQRVKTILSANQEASVSIESLMNDQDFRSRIARSQLEEAVAAFSGTFGEPISQALKDAGLTVSDINSLILFGGNTRVPLVQSAIKSVLGSAGEDKIAQNVNTDEAAVLGAAFYGASTGRSVRTKVRLEVREGLGRGIEWRSGGSSGTVFEKSVNAPNKTILTFPAKEDFSVDFISGSTEIIHVDVKGLHTALSNLTQAETSSAEVHLTMRLDARGFLQAANAVLHVPADATKESMTDKLKGLFGGSKDADAEEGKDGEEADAEEVKTKDKKIALKFTESVLGSKALTGEAKRQSKARLAAINAVEANVVARLEARNLLEGYLYKITGLLGEYASKDTLQKFGTAEEQQTLSDKARAALEWMSDAGEGASKEELLSKRSDIEAVESRINLRFQEHHERNATMDNFQKAMTLARLFYAEAKTNMTKAEEAGETSKFNDAELETVFNAMRETEQWVMPLLTEQKKLADVLTSDPVLLNKDLNDKGKALQMVVLRLQNKRIPKPKPKSTSTTTASTESTEPTGTAQESATTVTASEAEPTATASQDVPPHEEL